MPVVFACITPHGSPLLPELAGDTPDGAATRAAMHEVGRRCAAARPDVLVVATPHGTRVDGFIALGAGARAAGTVREGDRQVEMNVPLDLALTDRIAEVSRANGLPIAMTSCAGNPRAQSANWLDWGALIPLRYLGYGHDMAGAGDILADPPPDQLGPTVVLVAPSRSLPREAMVTFGRSVAAAAAGRRVAFVASCDWSHTHVASGPYGFHPAAARVDARVLQALRDDDLLSLIELPDDEVAAAAIDGLWQTLMLAGVKAHTRLRGEVLSYEVPSYYGMIVAAYEPVDPC